MITLKGERVYEGIAIGRIVYYKRFNVVVKNEKIKSIEKEIERFEYAKNMAILELEQLCDKTEKELGDINAAIFEIHQLLLNDTAYCNSVIDMIRKDAVNAEYAIDRTAEKYADMFLSMKDEYMEARVVDIKDISERVLNILSGNKGFDLLFMEPGILYAECLLPSEVMQLDKEKVLGLVIREGTVNSHTSILAKSYGIPTIVGVKSEPLELYQDSLAILDGFEGILYVEPEELMLNTMIQKQKEDREEKKELLEFLGIENKTYDGRVVELYANVSNVAELETVLKNDSGGIGLFRSEFLFLDRNTYPSEDEQYLVYRKLGQDMRGKKVVIRTLDIGADKTEDYFGLEEEVNPAMGYRGIRISLTRIDLFKTQLRAILRASFYGNLCIMFPMIVSMYEVIKIKEILAEVKMELKHDCINFNDMIEIGIMIETPAAVMISDELAKEVDFFSVGTNDLTQYTLAIDRQNTNLHLFYDEHHPAIFKMLEMIVRNAHANGIWAGICGELASDLTLTEQLIQMGYDELSVSPAKILPVRKQIRLSSFRKNN